MFGVAQMFLTLLASFSRGDLSDGLKRSFLFRAVLGPLCGMREESLPSAKSHDAVGMMLLAGVGFGIAGAYFSPLFLLLVLLLLGFTAFIFAFLVFRLVFAERDFDLSFSLHLALLFV